MHPDHEEHGESHCQFRHRAPSVFALAPVSGDNHVVPRLAQLPWSYSVVMADMRHAPSLPYGIGRKILPGRGCKIKISMISFPILWFRAVSDCKCKCLVEWVKISVCHDLGSLAYLALRAVEV